MEVQLLPQTHPALGDDEGVSGIVRVEADRGGEAEPAGVEIDELAQVGHILRGLVGHSGDVVLVDEEGRGALAGARHLLDIDHGAVSDAADAVEPGAPLPLQVIGGLGLAAEQQVGEAKNSYAHQDEKVKAKWNHDDWRETAAARRRFPQQNKA